MMYYSFRKLDYVYVFPSKLDNRIRLFFLVEDTEHLMVVKRPTASLGNPLTLSYLFHFHF